MKQHVILETGMKLSPLTGSILTESHSAHSEDTHPRAHQHSLTTSKKIVEDTENSRTSRYSLKHITKPTYNSVFELKRIIKFCFESCHYNCCYTTVV